MTQGRQHHSTANRLIASHALAGVAVSLPWLALVAATLTVAAGVPAFPSLCRRCAGRS